jgi:hypothetical protein
MRIKVYRGTPPLNDHSLCETCRHSTITRGRRLGEEIIRCDAHSDGTMLVRFVVTQCSAFLDATLPNYSELFEKAWILRPREGKRPAGFVRSSELPVRERYELMRDMPTFEP